MYKVVYKKQVIKFLQSQDVSIRNKILNFFDTIKLDIKKIEKYDVKPLKGYKDKYRLRVSKYRVIFSIENDILKIEVIKASSRGDVYK